MARKSLLTESEIRRFMKLASMQPVGVDRMQSLHEQPEDLGAPPPEGDLGAEEGLPPEPEAAEAEMDVEEEPVEDEVEMDVELDAADMEADTDMEMDDGPLEEGGDKKGDQSEELDYEKNESAKATDELVEAITKRVAARILKTALAKK